MEDEETQQSTLQSTLADAEADGAKLSSTHLQGVAGIILLGILVTLAIQRVGRSSLAAELRRWLPLLYTSVWGLAIIGITLIYAQGLSASWYLAIWLLFLIVVLSSVGWLRSVMSGVAISIEGRINIGDSVRIGELSGEVVGFGVRSLRLRAVDGSIHEIPNEKLVTEPVTNLSGEGGDSAAELVIPVPSSIDPNAAVAAAREIAILSPLASPRHQPEVFLEAGGPNGQQYEIRVRGFAFDAAYRDHFRSDVVARIQAEFAVKPSGLLSEADEIVITEP